jgi:glycosyltransferase involved in cell wall biosynthesis
MKIRTFIFTYNDERMIPYTMRHYTQFSTVIIVDNGSTDKTIETAFKHGACGRLFSSMHDELDDIKLAEMKSNFWKGCDDDWVIIADADEFVWHPDLIGILERTNGTIIEPKWGEMFSATYPTTTGQIYDEVKTGVIGGGFKSNIFRPSEIKEINYGVGCHSCAPEGNVIFVKDSGIMTLHMKNLTKRLLVDKAREGQKRLSKRNIQNGLSIQYSYSPEQISEYFDTYLAGSTQIIP